MQTQKQQRKRPSTFESLLHKKKKINPQIFNIDNYLQIWSIKIKKDNTVCNSGTSAFLNS